MSSLVLELQQGALDSSVSVTDLLRKALVVARKLDIQDIQEWLNHELNGYPEVSEVPAYRMLQGSLKAWNPYHGWQPLGVADAKIAELLSRRGTFQSIPQLESMKPGEKSGDSFTMEFHTDLQNQIMKAMNHPMRPAA